MAQTKISSFTDDTVSVGSLVNSGVNDSEQSSATKATLATRLSDSANNIVARVITYTGTYLKVKWFRNGKVFGSFKTRGYVDGDKAITSLEYLKTNSAGISAATSLALTGTQAITHPGTSQLTATLTLADSTTVDVTSKAVWSSATPAKATVDQAGLVTSVAAGTSVITAKYAGITSPGRTITVS